MTKFSVIIIMMNLYVSDLDGTLLTPDAHISNYTSDTLNNLIHSKGLNFTVATARTPATVVPILKKINFKLPIVVMNGAAIYDLSTGEYIAYNSISSEGANEIENMLNEANISYFTYTLKNNHIDVYFDAPLTPIQKKFMDSRKGSPLKSFIKGKFPRDTNVMHFLLMDKKEKILPISENIKCISGINSYMYQDMYFTDYYILEIFSDKSSKALSIQWLMSKYSFDTLTVFGDQINDIPMFKVADKCFAMDNAIDDLKSIATSVIDSNKNDGVVNYLKQNSGDF